MIVTREMGKDRKLTEEQKRELEEAERASIVYDEDCPELSPAMMKAMRCAVAQRNRLLARRSQEN